VGPRAGVDAVKRKIYCPSQQSKFGRPTHNPPLYLLTYPESLVHGATGLNPDRSLNPINDTTAKSALNECIMGRTRLSESLHILSRKTERISVKFGFGN
jgi:hypothetical protein